MTRRIFLFLALSLLVHLSVFLFEDFETVYAETQPSGRSLSIRLTAPAPRKPELPAPAEPEQEHSEPSAEISAKPEKAKQEEAVATTAPAPKTVEKVRKTKQALIKPAPPKEIAETPKPKQKATEISSQPLQSIENFEEESPAAEQSSGPSDFELWTYELQKRINHYKSYPYQAKRRKQQGEVQIEAIILPDGQLESARLVSGRKVFQASSLRAIQKALPLPPPVDHAVTVVLSIHYQLY